MTTEVRKVLAQSCPTVGTLTDVYTVPAARQAMVSTITACSQSAQARIRISVAVAGAADATSQYVVYGALLLPNETTAFTLGIALGAGDVIRCYTDNGCVSFNVFGVEIL